MSSVQQLPDLREHRAIRRALRMVAKGHLQGGRAGAGARELAERVGLSDLSVSLPAAQQALAVAGQAGDMLALAESHRILGLLAAGQFDWHLAMIYARLALEFGTLHEAESRLALGISAFRSARWPEAGVQLQAALQVSTDTGNRRCRRVALFELAWLSLDRHRPKSALQYLLALGQTEGWHAPHAALLAWAGRQLHNEPMTRQAEAEIARLALHSSDSGTHTLTAWVLAEGALQAGDRAAAAEWAVTGRRRAAEVLCSHQVPELADVPLYLARHGLIRFADSQLADILASVEAPACNHTGG